MATSNLNKLLKLVREKKPISSRFYAKLTSDVTISESMKKKINLYMRGDKRLSTAKLERDIIARKKTNQKGGGPGGIIEYVISRFGYRKSGTMNNGTEIIGQLQHGDDDFVNIGSVVMSYVSPPSTPDQSENSGRNGSASPPGTPDNYSPFANGWESIAFHQRQAQPQSSGTSVLIGSVVFNSEEKFFSTNDDDPYLFYTAESITVSSELNQALPSPFAANLPFSVENISTNNNALTITQDLPAISPITGYTLTYIARGGNGIVYELTQTGKDTIALKTFNRVSERRIQKMLSSTLDFNTHFQGIPSTCPTTGYDQQQRQEGDLKSVNNRTWLLYNGAPAYTMPLYSKGSLTDYIMKLNGNPQQVHFLIANAIMNTVDLLPNRYSLFHIGTDFTNFIHCDMKLDNVLVADDISPVLHDMDTVVVYQESTLGSGGITFKLPPEIINKLKGADFTPIFVHPYFLCIINGLPLIGTNLAPWEILIRVSQGRFSSNPIIKQFINIIRTKFTQYITADVFDAYCILKQCDVYSLGASVIMMALTETFNHSRNNHSRKEWVSLTLDMIKGNDHLKKYVFLYSLGHQLIDLSLECLHTPGSGGRKKRSSKKSVMKGGTTAFNIKDVLGKTGTRPAPVPKWTAKNVRLPNIGSPSQSPMNSPSPPIAINNRLLEKEQNATRVTSGLNNASLVNYMQDGYYDASDADINKFLTDIKEPPQEPPQEPHKDDIVAQAKAICRVKCCFI
jgi:hypothetical protein